MVIAYIGLGANLGNCRENILQAWARLGEVSGVKLLALSSPYSSKPVGMQSDNWFINSIGRLHSSLEPAELLSAMLAVEASLGRKRGLKAEPEDRSLDLDLLYWDDRISHDPAVILPHPEIANRLFVLLPLTEIAPELCHPVLKKTSVEMLQALMAKQLGTGMGSDIQKTSWSSGKDEVPE